MSAVQRMVGAAAGFFVAVGVLAGCGGVSPPPAPVPSVFDESTPLPSAVTFPNAPAPAAPVPLQQSTVIAEAAVPSPDEAQQADLLTQLGAVDAGLLARRSIDRSRNVCQDILAGVDHGQLVNRARLRFEGGSVPKLDDGQVEQIVSIIQVTFCH